MAKLRNGIHGHVLSVLGGGKSLPSLYHASSQYHLVCYEASVLVSLCGVAQVESTNLLNHL